jgi:heptaprenyl diphosphate synthase
MNTQKLVLISILIAISIVLNIIERFALGGLTGLPMIRLGLANIVVLMVLYLYQAKDAFLVLIIRIFLVGLFTSLFSPTFFLSLGGGLLAYLGMIIGKSLKVFSIIGVSVLGSFGHALGQIIAAIIILSTQELIVYFPWLVVLSLPTGLLTGFIALKMNQIIKEAFFKASNLV